MEAIARSSLMKEVIRRALRERGTFPTEKQNRDTLNHLKSILPVFSHLKVLGYNAFQDEVDVYRLGYPPLSADYDTAIEQNPDVVLVPLYGQTFDGYRLGRGGGFYDRFLKETGAIAIGVGLESRRVIFDPESHDVQMSIIATDKGVYSYL